MLNYHQASTSSQDHDDLEEDNIRDIHALTPPRPLPPPPGTHGRRRDTWETSSHRSSSLSIASEGGSSENFTTMSREFNALVLAGSSLENHARISDQNEANNTSMQHHHNNNNNSLLSRIREDEDVPQEEETNPLAIVTDINPFEEAVPTLSRRGEAGSVGTVQRVKKEEVETKINAWQNAKVAEINNRFKRVDAIINGWEDGRVQKASTKMKKVERKLEEKRAKALEKMQNEIAKAHRKAEERRASAEAKRGTKVARVLEVANLMRAVGRFPAKRSFFKSYP